MTSKTEETAKQLETLCTLKEDLSSINQIWDTISVISFPEYMTISSGVQG